MKPNPPSFFNELSYVTFSFSAIYCAVSILVLNSFQKTIDIYTLLTSIGRFIETTVVTKRTNRVKTVFH